MFRVVAGNLKAEARSSQTETRQLELHDKESKELTNSSPPVQNLAPTTNGSNGSETGATIQSGKTPSQQKKTSCIIDRTSECNRAKTKTETTREVGNFQCKYFTIYIQLRGRGEGGWGIRAPQISLNK